jgi:hypothetical protein
MSGIRFVHVSADPYILAARNPLWSLRALFALLTVVSAIVSLAVV